MPAGYRPPPDWRGSSVRAGLATAQRAAVKVGGKSVEVVHIRITADGQRVIEA